MARVDGQFGVYFTGIGGTGIVTANRIIASAAEAAGMAVGGMDQTGLSQMAGAVVSHLHLATDPRALGSATVGDGGADLYLSGDILQAAWGLGGQPVLGTLFAHWPQPDTDTALALARETIAASGYGGRCGATLVSGVLLVRCLGADTEAMRHLFIRLWQALRPLVIGRQACPPRIWNT